MPISITPTNKKDITKIICPDCGERVRGVGLEKDSKIDGLVFRCRRCGTYKVVKSE